MQTCSSGSICGRFWLSSLG
ncbi:hypothetical protein LINPERHAP1_LOCUS13566 [Linum perenne]